MLSVNDNRSRNRSRSPGRRERSTSRDVRAPSPARRAPSPSDDEAPARLSRRSKKYDDSDRSDDDGAQRWRKPREDVRYEVAEPRRKHKDDNDDRGYEVAEPRRRRDSDEEYEHARRRKDDRERDDRRKKDRRDESPKRIEYVDPTERKRDKDARHEHDGRDSRHPSYAAEQAQYQYAQPAEYTRHMSYVRPGEEREYAPPGAFGNDYEERDHTRHASIQQGPTGHYVDPARAGHGYAQPAGGSARYQVPAQYEYAQPSQNIKYLSKSEAKNNPRYMATSEAQIEVAGSRHRRDDRDDKDDRHRRDKHDRYNDRDDRDDRHDRRAGHGSRDDSRFVEIHPGGHAGGHASAQASGHGGGHGGGRALHAPHADGLESGLKRLSIHTGGAALGAGLGANLAAPGHHSPAEHGHGGHGLPPGSPLLESYKGTYQSISPLPSPMALPSAMDDGLSDLEPLEPEYGSDDPERRRPPKSALKKKSVKMYDPEADARAIAAELKHSRPEGGPLVQILPRLTDDHVLALRAEYKKHFKAQGKGINVAKHIKLKVPGNLGKAAYATALGRWESEAHWANFWYQSGNSRRELLIESLMGRTNVEIRNIKAAFSDKRYSDNLEKCMQTELKKDKFRHAVLLALEERRMEENERVSRSRVDDDVRDLYKALVAKDGGETAMIDIIVVRSDNHLREVLRHFEVKYRRNFAREMIQKSQNLVGETLAHILNGVLNRPVRDALLMHQALAETSKDRAELLASRLVRFHWEPRHLERVKAEYRQRYGKRMERDIEEGTKGDFGDFCVALCDGATK